MIGPVGGDIDKRSALEVAIGGPVAAHASVASAPAAPRATSSAEDYEAFLKVMHEGGKRPFRKPGVTVKQEFELWAASQAKAREAAAAKAAAAMAPGGNRLRA